jgi:peptide deformylase
MKKGQIKIYQEPDKVLRTTCQDVPVEKIADPKIQQVINDMKQALRESGDGVAIAAPQVGAPLRIFMIAGMTIDQLNNYHGEHISPDKVFINPQIVKTGKTVKPMKGEGCLSVRFVYGVTKRYDKATVKAFDEHGNEFLVSGSGLLAQIFQHEIDHLNGILFIDHADNIRKRKYGRHNSFTNI